MWNTPSNLVCSCLLTQLSILEGEPKKIHAKEPRGARKFPFSELETSNFMSRVLMGQELIA